MLITITILFLLTTGSIVSYRVFSQRQQIVQSVQNVQEAMRFAQKKARVGEKPTGCTTLQGYRVSGTSGGQSVTIRAICSNQNYDVTTYDLVGDATLSNNINVTFIVITGGASGTGTFRVSLGSYSYSFAVNQGGDISGGAFD